MKGKMGRVIENCNAAYPEPYSLSKGEILSVSDKKSEWTGWIWCTNNSGESRWVPERYLELNENGAIVKQEYNATELTVQVGETLKIEKVEADWVWVENQKGKRGWVPLKYIQIL